MDLVLHKHADNIVLALKELGYWDLADTIETGIDPIGKELNQNEYDEYVSQAKQIFEENGYTPAQVKSIDHKKCLI